MPVVSRNDDGHCPALLKAELLKGFSKTKLCRCRKAMLAKTKILPLRIAPDAASAGWTDRWFRGSDRGAKIEGR